MSSDDREAGKIEEGKSSGRRHKRVSAKDKMAAVLRVVKGEDAGAVADELGVSGGRVQQWHATFVAAGLEALEKNTHPKTLSEKVGANTKNVRAWVLLLIALFLTTIVLVRFLNRDTEQ